MALSKFFKIRLNWSGSSWQLMALKGFECRKDWVRARSIGKKHGSEKKAWYSFGTLGIDNDQYLMTDHLFSQIDSEFTI